MPKISGVIITFNEEENIARCINSIRNLVDEILVVDSGSLDQTREIAEMLGARVITHPFEGYIEQKNYAAAAAAHDFILSLDADEEADSEMQKAILSVKDHLEGVYCFNRLTWYCRRWIYHCGWYPDTKCRLFNRKETSWGGTNPHDKLNTEGLRITLLPGKILHYSYHSVEDHLRQTEKFTDIASQALFKKGKKAGWVKLYLSPLAKFLNSYFLRLGFLDGKEGFSVCRISARATYLKYRKLKKLHQRT